MKAMLSMKRENLKTFLRPVDDRLRHKVSSVPSHLAFRQEPPHNTRAGTVSQAARPDYYLRLESPLTKNE